MVPAEAGHAGGAKFCRLTRVWLCQTSFLHTISDIMAAPMDVDVDMLMAGQQSLLQYQFEQDRLSVQRNFIQAALEA